MSRSALRLKSTSIPTPQQPHTTLLSLPPTLRPTLYTTPPTSHTTRQNATTTTPQPTPKRTRPRTALFFPGQGVQRVGMTTDWLQAFPRTVTPLLEEIDHTLSLPLSRIIAEGPNSRLTATANAQPAIMATSILILRVLEREFGFKTHDRIDVVLGHSLGEFAALVAAGYLREADALRMVRRRGEVFERCSRDVGEEVGMVALVSEPEHMASMVSAIHEFLDKSSSSQAQVMIANVNAKNQIVLSGHITAITTLLNHLRQFAGHDPRAVRLKSDSPFHSPLMAPAADVMHRMLSQPSPTVPGENIILWPGAIPAISNVTARPFESEAQLKDLLARQAVETVRWHDSIVYLHREEKVRRWIGIGPGKVGRNLVGKEVGMKGAGRGAGVWGVSDPREVEGFLRELEETEEGEEEEGEE